MSENAIQLSGMVSERAALRYTPAGIPVLAFRVKHASTQTEDRIPRDVEFEIDAMAVGKVASQMESVRDGQHIHVRGFLALRSRLSTHFVLHVDQFELE